MISGWYHIPENLSNARVRAPDWQFEVYMALLPVIVGLEEQIQERKSVSVFLSQINSLRITKFVRVSNLVKNQWPND